MLVDMRSFDEDVSGKKARLALDKAGISLNENTVPDDPRPPYITSGLRIGTPAVTTQGMGPARCGRSPPSSTAASWAARTQTSSPRSATRSPPSAPSSLRTRRKGFLPLPTASEYGLVFGVAFGVTLVATPLCGRLARRLGVMAQPDEERRVHKVPTPYLGGRGHAHRLPRRPVRGPGRRRLLARSSRIVDPLGRRARRRGDHGGRHHRRRPAGVGAGEDGGHGARRQHPVPAGRHDVLLPHPVRRAGRPVLGPRAARHRALGARHGQRGQLHRRARRPGRRHRGDRGRRVLPVRPPPGRPGRTG